MFRRCGKGTKYIDINKFFFAKKRSEVKKPHSLMNLYYLLFGSFKIIEVCHGLTTGTNCL